MQINKNLKKCHKINKVLRYYCKTVKYSDTVLLPKTKFPQRLVSKKLIEQNKVVSEKGGFKDLYFWQKDNIKSPEFILHDGPPYANGQLHSGHLINKILKDVINRYQIVQGRRVNYIPGFDCHGLPIELKALKKVKSDNITSLDIRRAAQQFASKTIEEQSRIFQSWGVIGDWNNSYSTYSVPYVKNELQQFYKLYERNLVFRDFKPVYWSPSSRTALAEAELQYNDNHKSTAIILKLKLSKLPEILKSYTKEVYALIWTTTPWTLPANQAVCYNPLLSYSLIKSRSSSGMYICATDLINHISNSLKEDFDIILTFKGKALSDTKYIHPFHKSRELSFLPGSHATSTKGTGLVHTAPAHGPDDFLIALNHKIPVKCLVDESGKYTEEVDKLQGLEVLTNGNEEVLKILQEDILNKEEYIHSYPYDWRTKKPVILRASQQWFIDTNALKDRAVELLTDVKILPEKYNEIYRQSLINQIKKRPYWCISRQRVWGVPIPVFYHNEKPLITENLISHLYNLLEKHGTDFWWTLPTDQLISKDLLQKNNISPNDLKKGNDIFDIWLDSGISWSYVLTDKVADVYLEGVDQFNGWFQSSLLMSVAIRDKAPFKTIFVHGFAVDENGMKMSKSLENYVDPQELLEGSKKQKPLGIDVLRWWVAGHASQGDNSFVSSNIFQVTETEIQKIRNTLRFAIGALNDYKYDQKDTFNLRTVDRYLLHLTYEFDKQVKNMFDEYQFNKVCIATINFVTNPVSALYYSVIKDRLYCDSLNDAHRRSAQYVLKVLLETISKAISPIVPHLIEEIYLYRTDIKPTTFFKSDKIKLQESWNQPDLAKCIEQALNIKKYINKQYSNPLEINCEVVASDEVFNKLQIFQSPGQAELIELLQLAEFSLKKNSELGPGAYNLNLRKTDRVLCNRCRKYNCKKEEHLCTRCYDVINFKERSKIVT